MRKDFESELAKDVSGQSKRASKAWVAMALCAAILVIGVAAATVVAAGNMNGDCDQTKDQLKDGSCEETDCDGTPDQDQVQDQLQDGSCEDCVCQGDIDGDGICDNPDCPCNTA